MGLLDWIDTPGGQGLLAAGLGALGSRTALGGISRGGLLGLQTYAGAQERQNFDARQKAMDERSGKMFDLQMSQHQAALQKAKQAAEQQQMQQNYIGSIGKVTSPVVGAQPNQFDPMQWIGKGGSVDDAKALAGVGNWGKAAVKDYKDVRGPDGSVQIVGFDEFGNQVQTGAQPFKAPEVRDFGGYLGGIDPITGKVSNYGQKTMTAAERDSSARGWASNGLAERRLAFDQSGGVDGSGVNQAGLTKQFGKPPVGFRWKPDGSMEYIPGGPADQKAQLQKSGEGTVASVVADLRDKYNLLDSENAIVSEKNKVGTNIGAWLGSTGLGQTVGGAVGTKAQSARDSIAMTRPLLLQAIMKATGMSAKQMDSNAELKLYLATATDPTLGLQANQEALNRIENLYGGGAQPNSTAQTQQPRPQTPQQPKPASGAPAIGETRGGYRFKGGNPADRNNWQKV